MHTKELKRFGSLLAAAALALAGCQGSKGDPGQQGAQGDPGAAGSDATAYGTLTGAIGDTYGNKVAGATVSMTVGTDKITATSDANGAYTLPFAPGPRTVSFTATGYKTYSQTVEAAPAKTVTLNVTLNPTGPVAVTAARTDTASVTPGTQVSLSAQAFVFDKSITGTPTYKWTVVSGPAATFDNDTSATPKATLASAAAFKKYLVELAAPLFKVNADEPPVNVDRYQVVPISYEQAMSQGNTTKFKVTATVGGKSYTATVSVAAKIPAVPSTGLQTVPVNSPVVLQGQFPFKNADGSYVFTPKATWDWKVTGPGGAAVTVNDATTAYPDFTPTVKGTYIVEEPAGTKVFEIYAGNYVGAMSGPGAASSACTACHKGALDNFTPWLTTGHKEVMYAGIMEPLPDGHYAATCTPCHTVGNGLAGAGGFADQSSASVENVNFSPLQGDLNAEQDFWKLYPKSAKLAGIQCENCHGPQDSDQHTTAADTVSPRVSFSANVCATCHARAPKHGRFSQWVKSGHASFATFTFNSDATGGLSAGCACCHSAQGFKAYRAALPTANGNRSATVLPTGLSITNAQPITCAACHDTHDEGDASKAEWTNLAKVGPAEGETYMLPSGFAASGVGKGALCIACHNSRQGYSTSGLVGPYLHEDGDPKYGTLTSYGAPHEACQGDVLMGRNAYWFGSALRNSPLTKSKHAAITDTCVTCHMELTTLDLSLSEAGQTRHDFKATPDVCNKCHTAYSTESIQADFDSQLATVKQAVGTAILALKYGGVGAIPTGTTAVLVANRSGMVDVTSAGVTQRWFIGDKTGQDAFLADPNNGGALVQGCTMVDAVSANCNGFLQNAPGISTIPAASVTAAGVNGVIAKALWNTVLVQDDASRGVHNYTFAFQTMANTIEHVNSFTP